MRCFPSRCYIWSAIVSGCFTLLVSFCGLADAQTDSAERPMRLIQSQADIAALPSSQRTDQVRVGFKPAQSNSATGYRGSFYQQQASADVYPYPASNNPRSGASSRSAYALSQGGSGGRLSNQISIGSNTSTGDLGNSRYATNTGVAGASSNWNRAGSGSAYNSNANSRSPVEQQRSSTLNPVEQNRVNQAAAQRLKAEQARVAASSQTRRSPPADRTASRDNLFSQSGSQAMTAFRQSNFHSGQTGNNAAAGVRCAQACTCCPQGYTPVAAGYQGAAFQPPAINPTVGAGLGLGVPPLNIQNPAGVGGGFNQPALPQQACCQPQAGFQPGFQGGGYQGVGYQGGGYQFGAGVGTPQFGAQGARWWTPFVRGSGVYTPLLDLTPNNSGTYLGQGIIGQPTAYVNGQLLRNLLRYLSP